MKQGMNKTSTAIASQKPACGFLTAAQFRELITVPPEAEWFANLDSEQTRRAYRNDIGEFMRFAGIVQPAQFRDVVRAHVLAWRKALAMQSRITQ